MDLDAILEDIPENRSSDIGGNAMDILTSVKNGFDIVLKKVADMEKQQNMLLGKIDAMEKRISGVVTGETQTGKTVNGHGDVTDESIDASADKNDVIADIKLNTHSNDGQDFVSIDTSEKVIHNFRRVSLDAKINSLDTITVDVDNNLTDISFSNYQFRFNDKEMHMVANPKCLEFELVVISVFSIFTLVNKIESFVSSTPEAALCTGALFADSVKRQMEAYSCLHKPIINAKSWSTMSLDEAILRARLIAAPINKGGIIMELQSFRSPFGKNTDISLWRIKLSSLKLEMLFPVFNL